MQSSNRVTLFEGTPFEKEFIVTSSKRADHLPQATCDSKSSSSLDGVRVKHQEIEAKLCKIPEGSRANRQGSSEYYLSDRTVSHQPCKRMFNANESRHRFEKKASVVFEKIECLADQFDKDKIDEESFVLKTKQSLSSNIANQGVKISSALEVKEITLIQLRTVAKQLEAANKKIIKTLYTNEGTITQLKRIQEIYEILQSDKNAIALGLHLLSPDQWEINPQSQFQSIAVRRSASRSPLSDQSISPTLSTPSTGRSSSDSNSSVSPFSNSSSPASSPEMTPTNVQAGRKRKRPATKEITFTFKPSENKDSNAEVKPQVASITLEQYQAHSSEDPTLAKKPKVSHQQAPGDQKQEILKEFPYNGAIEYYHPDPAVEMPPHLESANGACVPMQISQQDTRIQHPFSNLPPVRTLSGRGLFMDFPPNLAVEQISAMSEKEFSRLFPTL